MAPELATFAGFLSVLGERPRGTTLDRIDSNGHYESANVRWATTETQANNTRANRRLTIDGQTKTVAQWTRSLGLTRDAFEWRFDHGLPLK